MRNLKANVLMFAAQQAPPGGTAVEIGCIRESIEVPQDGFSTVYLAIHCEEHNVPFYSVDIFYENIDKARSALDSNKLYKAELICCDGKDFLQQWNIYDRGLISFLYLDSHRDPQYSLDQFLAARDKLAPDAIVAIDDAHVYDGFDYGKATYLIDLFKKENIKYKILSTEPGFKMVIAKIPAVAT
jgi:predicted O-methyltransferase YrrM